jgi:hypothetical protein
MSTLTTTGYQVSPTITTGHPALFIESGMGRGCRGRGRLSPGILASWIAPGRRGAGGAAMPQVKRDETAGLVGWMDPTPP